MASPSHEKKVPLSQTIRIQEAFLNHCRREKIRVVIQLFDQSIVDGWIVGFDQESIVVMARNTQQLLYKSSVVCIKPYEELHLIFQDRWHPTASDVAYPRVQQASPRYRH
ncbi:MAG: RNA chaperone Hfq [Saccharofermentanales bacterium]|jgi:RNA chaperone Hfq